MNFDPPRIYVRFLPLVLAAIWAGTALSVYVSPPFVGQMLWRAGKFDVLINVVLYIPLGVALSRYGVFKCGLAGAALSIAVEAAQLFFPDRFTAVTDVMSNALGAVIGCIVVKAIGHRGRWVLNLLELRRSVGVFILFVCFLFIGVVSWPRMPSDFRNWDTACRLSLGDEITADRLWAGEIFEVWILPVHLDASVVKQLSSKSDDRVLLTQTLDNQAVFLRRFSDDFESVRGKSLLTPQESKQFFSSFSGSNELSILVWFRTDSDTQGGPARIVSYSTSIWKQNFALGQEGRNIVFRVLTPTSAPGGFTPQLETRPVLNSGRAAFIAATYDGRNSKVYLDGRLISRLNLRARGRSFPFLADIGLPAAAVFVGVTMGLGAIGLIRGGRKRRWLTGACTGVLGGFLFVAVGGVDALPGFAPLIPLFALGGGLVAGFSTRVAAPCANATGDLETRT
jgi:hypothetical protein